MSNEFPQNEKFADGSQVKLITYPKTIQTILGIDLLEKMSEYCPCRHCCVLEIIVIKEKSLLNEMYKLSCSKSNKWPNFYDKSVCVYKNLYEHYQENPKSHRIDVILNQNTL